jgi:gliding motility-associated-like protein
VTGLTNGAISNPIANSTITTLYMLTATNTVGGCTATDAVLVTINNTYPTANAGLDVVKSCTINTTGATIGTTAEPGTTYSWSPATGLSSASVSNPIANPTVTTTYTLTATNTSSGCSSMDTILVTVNTAIPTANAGADVAKICTSNASGALVGATAVAGMTYSWSPPTGLSGAAIANPTANPSVTTTYTLTATNTASGCAATDAVVVTVNTTAPIADAGPDVVKSCVSNANGATIGVTAVAGTTYSWSPAIGLSNATVSNPIANPLVTTTYTLTATNTANGCTSTDTVLVTVNTITPSANAGADFTQNCLINTNGAQIGATAEAGTTYSWSPTAGLSNPNISNPTANPSATTTYTLTATNVLGGCSATDTAVVTINNTLPTANAGADFTKTYATNPNGKAIGAVAVAGTTYSWSPATGLSDATISNPTANPSVTTTYTLTATNTVSGCTSTDDVLVTVILTSSTADAGLDFTKTCSTNASGKQIGVNSVGGTTYSWSPSAGLSNATVSNPIANPSATTTYTLTAKNTASGFTATDAVIVTVDTNSPIADAGLGFTKTCVANAAGATIGALAIAGTTYSWSPALGLSNASISNPIANPSVTTSYTLIATSANGCTATSTVLVMVNTITPIANAGTPFTKTCATNTNGAIIGAVAEAGTTYSWSPTAGLSSGSISNPNANPSVTTTYILTATNILGGCSTTDTVLVTINNTLPIADAGTPFTKTCASNTSGKQIGAAAVAGTTYQWTSNNALDANGGLSDVNSSNPTANPTKTTSYKITVTNTASGCTAASTVVVTVNTTAPTAPIAASPIQPTCTTATGSVVLSGLPAGNWSINPGNISGSGASTSVNGLAPGTYSFTVTNVVGCTSVASANVVINTQPVTPAKPIVSGLVQPTCAVGGSVLVSGLPAGTWTLNQSGTSTALITGNTATKTVDNLLPGTYQFIAVSDKGCTSVASDNVVMNAVSGSTVVSVLQPTCSLATGTVSFNGLEGSWTIAQTGVGSANYSGTGSVFTTPALVSGDYNFVITSGSICASSNSTITINPPLITPAKPTFTYTPPTCDIAQGTIVASNLPATNWEVEVFKIGTGVIRTIQGIGATYSETGVFNVGNFTVTVKNDVGCVSPTSDVITGISQPITPVIPNIGTITQPTCTVATGSFKITNYNAALTYSFSPSAGVSRSGDTVTAPEGTYTVTVSNATCTSLASADIIINKQPAKPTPPVIGLITQPTCDSAIASVALSGLPAGDWKLTVNVAGIRVTDFLGSGATTILSGATSGTYNGTVTDLTEGCTSDLTANYVVNPQPNKPVTPVLGLPTQPTCTDAKGFIKITNMNPSFVYVVTPDTDVLVMGDKIIAPAGTYTVKALYGVCESSESVAFVITRALVVPSAPIIGTIEQMTCNNDLATFELTGLPAGDWTLTFNDPDNSEIPGTGTSIYIEADIYSVGNFNVTVTNADQCTSVASSTIVIDPQPITPVAPIVGTITQPTCTDPKGSVVLGGLPAGNWTITQLDILGNSSRVSIPGSGAVTTITGLTPGRHRFTVSNGTCTSLESVDVVIKTQPVTPIAPIPGTVIQPTCDSSLGSLEITGLPAGNWVLTGAAGNTFSGSGSTTVITTNNISLLPGIYKVTVTNEAGCVSPFSTDMILNPQPNKPTVPLLSVPTQPICTVATGSFTITNTNPAYNYIVEPATGVFIMGNQVTAPAGTYTVKAFSGICESVASLEVIINSQPKTPTAPIVGTITHPSCESAYGSVALSGLPAGNWEIDVDVIGLRHTLFYGSGPTTIIFGTTAGTYQGTVKDLASGCTSVSIPVQTLNSRPITPTAPIVGTITQPSCTVATGSVALSGLPTGNWTIDQKDVSGMTSRIIHTGNTPETIIAGLTPGIHRFTVSNGACTSAETVDVIIESQPSTPSAPIVGTVTQPTCDSEIASAEVSGLPFGDWTLTGRGGRTFTGSGTSAIITTVNMTVLPGTYNLSVTNVEGCTSAFSTDIVITAKPIKPTVLTIDSMLQPSCSASLTGTVVLGNLPQGNWTISQSGTVDATITGSSSTQTITGLTAGNYEFVVANSIGCVSDPTVPIPVETLLCATNDFNDVLENQTLTVSVDSLDNLLKNDFSQDNNPIEITEFYANGLTQRAGSTANLPQGDLIINADGSYLFVPVLGYSGQLIVTYSIFNKSIAATANLVLVVSPLPSLIIAQDDAAVTREDFPVYVYVLSNDTFGKVGPDVVPLVISTPPLHGTVAVDDSGTPDDFNDDTVIYTPNEAYFGSDSFMYTISNLNGQKASAKVNIQVEQILGATLNGMIYDSSKGNAPLGSVPVTLIPQAPTTGPILYQLTKPDGSYSFSGMANGNYLLQIQDVNLNRVSQLYAEESSIIKVTLDKHYFDSKDVAFENSSLPVMGDCVWYDINRNGIQDEWFDANNDFKITKNIPDAEGNIDYSQWEWVDINGDGSYEGDANIGELNSAGFGDSKGLNVQITGANNYSKKVVVGIQGYWINQFDAPNPWGDYTATLIMDETYDSLAQFMKATKLVKMLPSTAKKGKTAKTMAGQNSEVCGLTDTSVKKIVLHSRNSSHFDLDFFGVDCKTFAGILAFNDNVDRVINGVTGQDAVLNIFDNDTNSGLPLQLTDVVTKVIVPDPYLVLNFDGAVDVKPNTPGGIHTFTYQICEVSNPANCVTAEVTVVVDAPSDVCKLEVFNAISKNGDGKNDILHVEGIDCYPDNKVSIYNRWGVLVYEREQYNNADKAFRGQAEGRGTLNAKDGLPEGTYYYFIKYKDSLGKENVKKGYLYIKK